MFKFCILAARELGFPCEPGTKLGGPEFCGLLGLCAPGGTGAAMLEYQTDQQIQFHVRLQFTNLRNQIIILINQMQQQQHQIP